MPFIMTKITILAEGKEAKTTKRAWYGQLPFERSSATFILIYYVNYLEQRDNNSFIFLFCSMNFLFTIQDK